MTDIAERLRQAIANMDLPVENEDLREAVYEIERLRELLAHAYFWIPMEVDGGLGHMISQGAAKRKAADASRETDAL